MKHTDLSQDQLHSVLIYDYCSGFLTWKTRHVSMFVDGPRLTASHKAATWNGKHAGRHALTAIGSHGYRCGDVLGCPVLAHRVVFCMCFGYWPEVSDHIDGDRLNNRILNLREVSDRENSMNRGMHSNNRSGFMGVSWDVDCSKWRVHANNKYVGVFIDYDEAVAARVAANENLGFHKNHGRK